MHVDFTTPMVVTILLLASMSIVATFIGVTLAIWVGRNERMLVAGIGFSAGIMLLISLFELVPQGLSKAGTIPVAVAFVLGVTVMAILHWMIPHTHLMHEKGIVGNDSIRTAYLVAFGLILHDFPEGMAMANSYLSSPSLGILVALAIALHNIPEEFAMAAPVVAIKRKRFLYRAALVSGLAEPLGAMIGLVAVNARPGLNPLLMVFAAGAMVFVSVHELIPMAKRYRRTAQLVLGMLLSLGAYLLLGLGVAA